MPLYTGDKIGFGVAPAEEGGGGANEVGYSTSFDNVSHSATARTEQKWIVPKTARYNFEVWGADGGMGIRGDTNNNGGIPRYGRGGKVEASFLLDAGTEIGIMIGDNGLPCYDYNASTYLNDGTGGWGGFYGDMAMADGGNSIYSKQSNGNGGTGTGTHNWKGAGGGGGTIVRLFEGSNDSTIMIVAGGGGGAGARGNDNNNSHNQGGAGGNANEKMNETQWGRRGYFSGDTSYGWPSGNATHAGSGSAGAGGNGGNGHYAGGGGGGGGCGGGGGSATCSYCGSSGGSGGGCGSQGQNGNGYTGASGGAASSNPATFSLVGAGGNIHSNLHGGGGGGGYRGGGSGYNGNGSGHAGGGGGGGASSYCMGTGNSYDVKGLNGLTTDPRYTSEQKPMRLGNPGGGKVFIWEADKDPLGKNRSAEMTADKIQYLCRSSNGGASNSQRLYYIGSASNGSSSDGGDPDYSCYNNYPYTTATNTCDAIVMEIGGNGLWELHSVTVGAGAGAGSGRPNTHRCWVHVIEGTETGGVGIHTEKFDNNNPTGFNDPCNGWWAHYRSSAKQQNTIDGYIELFFEKPVVMNRGEKYTIALDWSCGGTNSTINADGLTCMNNGAVVARTLIGSNKGTANWDNVTAYNGPHGLGSKNSNNGMETSASQGQMVHFGVRSIQVGGGGGGGGGTLGSQSNPAKNAREMFDAGQRTNGYYWIKGNGAISAARQIYCIMDDAWGSWSGGGGGWMVIANHDAQKQPNQGHQARPTSNASYVGSDDGAGNPATSSMIPEKSFSVNMQDIPFTKVMQFVYTQSGGSMPQSVNWLTNNPHCYWCSRFNSEQTIPTDGAWILVFDDKGLVLSWAGSQLLKRHLYNNNDENCEAFGCMNSSGQSPVSRNGSGGNQSDPVYIATWAHSSNTNNYETISWCDTGTDGYDDWQDGSGQSDQWYVEGQGGKGTAQGKPSMIVVQ